ncbi:hypothetical protein QVD17_00005 [Tagetes erecta]|uniref:Uncharacterized protein n=1 Tax=Tagetes erecta TaxID=13708 RepID=A0AAD8P6L3_TARER|nr:hypothetical protein QVD17_00005 [Tagetes erecta]
MLPGADESLRNLIPPPPPGVSSVSAFRHIAPPSPRPLTSLRPMTSAFSSSLPLTSSTSTTVISVTLPIYTIASSSSTTIPLQGPRPTFITTSAPQWFSQPFSNGL